MWLDRHLNCTPERALFSLNPSLRSIATGVNVHLTINVDEAVAVWDMILTGMTFAEYTFQKKNLYAWRLTPDHLMIAWQ